MVAQSQWAASSGAVRQAGRFRPAAVRLLTVTKVPLREGRFLRGSDVVGADRIFDRRMRKDEEEESGPWL